LKRIKKLTEALPRKDPAVAAIVRDPLATQLKMFESKYKELRRRDAANVPFQKLSSTVMSAREAEDYKRKWQSPTGLYQTAEGEVFMISLDVAHLEGEVNSFAERALNDSEAYRDSLDRSYRRYSIASYILYAIGWCLGLAGRMFGIDVGVE
jgi:hypothetical protein